MDKLAIVDIETTGSRPQFDRVIELGVVLVDGLKVVDTWSSLINPNRSLNPFISKITGISQAQLLDAPLFEDVFKDFYEMLDGRLFMAHNVRFDYSFLRHEFNRLGVDFNLPHVCSVKLSRSLFPEYTRHSLDSLIQRYDLAGDDRHRALEDALIVSRFLEKARTLTSTQEVTDTIQKLLKRPALPAYISSEDIDRLPSSPGVYLFYGEDDQLLYVGKSIHIRDRVLSHFYADLRITKELRIKERIRHIETKTTAGELSALLLESQLVKELKPLYNQKLRKKKLFATLQQELDTDGYQTVIAKRQPLKTYAELQNRFGIFRSVKQAHKTLRHLSKRYELCNKKLLLERGRGPCFGFHLQNCRGACIGKETPRKYNQRLYHALEDLRILAWPYERPIVIHEYNQINDKNAYHVFDRWSHLGSTDDSEEIKQLITKNKPLDFDVDTYHILKHFLEHNSQSVKIL